MFTKNPAVPFRLFGGAHIITALILLMVFVIMTYLCKYKTFRKHYKRFLFLGLIVLDLGYRLWAGFYERPDYVALFSIHISSASVWLSIALLYRYKQRLFDILFYWGLLVVPQAIITPGIPQYGFPHARFFHILLIHYMVIFTVVYFMKIEDKKLSDRHLMFVLAVTHVYAVCIFVVNQVFGTNYMFIGRKTNLPSLIQYLGDWPYYIVWLDIILVGLFVTLHYIYKLIERKKYGSI